MKTGHKIITTLTVVWGMLMVFCLTPSAGADNSSPKMAKRFVGFEHGMGIGGWLTNYKRFNVLPDKWKLKISIGDYEHFDSYITKKDIENMASFGVDHIRLGFDQIVLEEKPYVYRKRTFKCVDNFVKWCHECNVNAVLNLHKAVGNYCDVPSPVNLLDDAELQNRFVALWAEFERRYHNDNSVAFELLNEVKNVDPKLWNALAARTVKEIRKTNPDRKIIIGSTCWNSASNLKYLQLFDDENVMYTFHIYSPFEFTHQRGVLQKSPLYYNREMPYPCDIERYRDYKRFVEGAKNPYSNLKRMDIKYMRQCLQPAFDFVKAHPDKILWCGEFGTIRHCNITSRENWMNDVILLLKEHDIPYCVWNYLSTPNDGNRFSLVDDDKRQILSPRMLRIIQGDVHSLPEKK
ncbi:MAG: cellulase family glycosylhydrolase [Kiritimatiellae bacterium]|jgi:endoglucanase|nr:cellulase family glycosylhydrolase [Kiritimatiellia bacterium]